MHLKKFITILAGLTLLILMAGCSSSPAATSELINPQEYVSEFQNSSEHILIDVRTPEEFASGHIAGAVNIPVDQVSSRLDEIPSDKDVVVYCRSGNRSAQAAQTLVSNGYTSVYDLGGIIEWEAAGLPVE